MINRYKYSNQLIEKFTNRKYLSSTIYPKIAPTEDDLYIIADEADKLDVLANKYYGSPRYWWVIAIANNLNDASVYITPGTQLRIPSDLPKILTDMQKLNK